MNKFNVDDLVIGAKSKYNFTNEDMKKGVITRVMYGSMIEVMILEHINSSHIGERHVVESNYFELYKEKKVMNRKELEDKITEMKVEIEKLEVELNSKSAVFEPEIDDKYYFISELGKIIPSSWDCDQIDVDRFEFGNAFETEEQAEREAFETKLIRKLKRFALENNEGEIDWEDNSTRKYYIFHSSNYSDLGVDYDTSILNFGKVYFTSRIITEKAIEEFKEEFMKYF